MSLKTFVKIGKIDNLSDARYCAGMMVDILGFNLEEGTEGYVSPENFSEISEWVAGVTFCGEFANAQAAEIKLATTQYKIDYLEVQNVDLLEELSELDNKLILKVVISSEKDLEQLTNKLELASGFVEHVIITSVHSELSDAIVAKLTSIETDLSILRGFDINEVSANEAAESELFRGIEVEGSPEDRPGFKDYGIVMDILEELEED
ncbi:MAG: phosphoribosylanthranilate isomerase [Flammeovirgaceae bacterium]|nr:phosphoribosylanthranilate isomerase [Flammeovirgaceae bacterium]HCX24111.1 phosphoribosylanthranilate isomerase [Cytophagales bacterium]|tara:strand:- start:756 stop:1376 length:621 start_codon:yes stop_codon:yes gene_type:complete